MIRFGPEAKHYDLEDKRLANIEHSLGMWARYVAKTYNIVSPEFFVLNGHLGTPEGLVKHLRLYGGVVFGSDMTSGGFCKTDTEPEDYRIPNAIDEMIPKEFLFSHFMDQLFHDKIDCRILKSNLKKAAKTGMYIVKSQKKKAKKEAKLLVKAEKEKNDKEKKMTMMMTMMMTRMTMMMMNMIMKMVKRRLNF